jgi:hypothetical protein
MNRTRTPTTEIRARRDAASPTGSVAVPSYLNDQPPRIS